MDEEYDYPDREPYDRSSINYMTRHYYPEITGEHDGKKVCIRKLKQKNGKYKCCGKELSRCNRCHNLLCPLLECALQHAMRSCSTIYPYKEHAICFECERITCEPSGICDKCETRHYYDMITEDIAIGSNQAPYTPFDIVINLDYPYNKVKEGEIRYSIENNVHVIRCGFEDTIKGGLDKNVDTILERIENITQTLSNPKILFHCYAGVSRSSTLAIAYLAKRDKVSTQEIYEMAKSKRSRIQPNQAFQKVLGLTI